MLSRNNHNQQGLPRSKYPVSLLRCLLRDLKKKNPDWKLRSIDRPGERGIAVNLRLFSCIAMDFYFSLSGFKCVGFFVVVFAVDGVVLFLHISKTAFLASVLLLPNRSLRYNLLRWKAKNGGLQSAFFPQVILCRFLRRGECLPNDVLQRYISSFLILAQ